MAASAVATNLKTIILNPLQKHTATIIFLHGSGDTGDGILGWVRALVKDDFRFPHIKVIFPTAPARPYTPAGGALSTVWHDRIRITPNVPECLQTINPVCDQLGQIIAAELAGGIPKKRMILGGFSMGGGMAMHLAYRFHPDVAGVFALSSFLNQDSAVYKVLDSSSACPPLFTCQGLKDPLVQAAWWKETVTKLSSRGVACECHTFPSLYHDLDSEELYMLIDWIKKRIPETF